jgi:hypothetical protein
MRNAHGESAGSSKVRENSVTYAAICQKRTIDAGAGARGTAGHSKRFLKKHGIADPEFVHYTPSLGSGFPMIAA